MDSTHLVAPYIQKRRLKAKKVVLRNTLVYITKDSLAVQEISPYDTRDLVYESRLNWRKRQIAGCKDNILARTKEGHSQLAAQVQLFEVQLGFREIASLQRESG